MCVRVHVTIIYAATSRAHLHQRACEFTHRDREWFERGILQETRGRVAEKLLSTRTDARCLGSEFKS